LKNNLEQAEQQANKAYELAKQAGNPRDLRGVN